MKIRALTRVFLAPTMAGVLLTGCLSAGDADLQTWMAEQRATMRPTIKPIPEPKNFVPVAFQAQGQAEPFSNQRLTQALRLANKSASANDALVAPELNRRKEALEAYPLDTMSMAGSINKGGTMIALVRVDKLVHQVKVGNYLGQNFGKITKITETGVVLREIVQDATGEWQERTAQLELQERSK